MAIVRAIKAVGIPHTVGAKTPQADAIGLLKLAAEIEHALMVQYIYAATSVVDDAARSKIMRVAIQEMGHLISVQNLLLALGGEKSFHLGRDGIRAASVDNPIPLVLEPVSRKALAKFIAVEMPAEVPEDQKARVAELVRLATESGNVSPHRVGAIYAALFWLFQDDDNSVAPLNLSTALGYKAGWHVKPEDFANAATIAAHEATREEWAPSHSFVTLHSVTTRESARKLIEEISEQGEGLGDAHDSHFWEFMELLDTLEAGQLTTVALPENPVAATGPAPDAGAGTKITHPYLASWADLSDCRYNLVLLDIWHALSLPQSNGDRETLIGFVFRGGMKLITKLSSQILLLRTSLHAPDAGPPFGLFQDDFPEQETLRWQRHADHLTREAQIITRIRGATEFTDDLDGNDLLLEIENFDKARETLVKARLSQPPTPLIPTEHL